jgi:hypothetical protein
MEAQCTPYVLDVALLMSGDAPSLAPVVAPLRAPTTSPFTLAPTNATEIGCGSVNPCMAGGVCIDVPATPNTPKGFVCKCTDGHSGDLCEIQSAGCSVGCWLPIAIGIFILLVVACVCWSRRKILLKGDLTTKLTAENGPS